MLPLLALPPSPTTELEAASEVEAASEASGSGDESDEGGGPPERAAPSAPAAVSLSLGSTASVSAAAALSARIDAAINASASSVGEEPSSSRGTKGGGQGDSQAVRFSGAVEVKATAVPSSATDRGCLSPLDPTSYMHATAAHGSGLSLALFGPCDRGVFLLLVLLVLVV